MQGGKGVAVVTALLLAVGAGAWLLWPDGDATDADLAAVAPPPAAPKDTAAPAPAPPTPAPRPSGDGEAVGRLVRSRDGSGMAGTVRLRSRDGAEWTAVAGPNGEFRITGLPRNTAFDFEATAPGCATHRVPSVWLGASGPLEVRGLVLGAGVPLEVLAVDAAGAPVRGAEVAVRRAVGAEFLLRGYGDRAAEERATTDADGRARFPAMATGWWIVDAAAKGFGDERRGVTLREGTPFSLRIDLSTACALFGKVLDETGKPAVGVAVQAIRGDGWWDEGAPRGSAVSGEDGAYRIERLVAGSHLLALRPGPGIVECAGRVDVAGDTPRDFRLAPRSRLLGRVEDAETGRPVAGARVEVALESEPGAPYRSEARTTTDGMGGFLFEAAPAAAVERFSVQAAGYVAYPDTRTPPASVPRALLPGASHAITVSLHRGATVRGTVRDPQGRVVAGAWVGLVAATGGGDLLYTDNVRSDAEGRYRIEAANPGRNVIRAGARNLHLPGVPRDFRDALAPGSPPRACNLEVPESGEIARDLALVPDCRVEGRMVHRDGTPAANVVPRLVAAVEPDRGYVHEGAPSREDGTFVLEDFDTAPGEFRVEAGGGLGRLGLSEPFTLVESGVVRGLVVTVGKTGSILGRVRRVDGRALESAKVRVVAATADSIRKGNAWNALREAKAMPTAADGAFCAEGLAPGPWTPVATAEGCVESLGEPVVLEDGEMKSGVDVVLPAAREIAGRVVNGSGAPVPGAFLSAGALESWSAPEGAVSAVAPWSDGPGTRSDADGRFVLRGLGPGTCCVVARAEECAPWSGVVEAGKSDLVVALAAGLRIEGVVRDKAGGKPVEGVRLNCFGGDGSSGEAWTAADGTFALGGLHEGPYNVHIFARTGQPWAPVSVNGVAAGTKGLQLEVQAGLTISGRCVDATGRPFDARNLKVEIMSAGDGTGRDLAADGSFTFERLNPGPCRITVTPSGSRGVGAYLVKVAYCQAGDHDVVVALTRGKSITGRVVTEDGSPPGQDLTLESCLAGSRGVGACFMHDRIQEDGTFRTDPYEEGAAQDLLVHAPGGRCAVLREVAPGSEGVVLRLESTVSISGRVAFPEGAATEGAYVVAIPAAGVRRLYYAELKKDRSFAFDALPRDAYRLYARSQYRNLAPVEWATPLSGGETDVVVRTVVGNVLRVKVRRADGSPLADTDALMIDFQFGGLLESNYLYRDGDASEARGLPAGPVSLRLVSRPSVGKPGDGVLANLVVPCEEQTLTAPR